VSLCYPIAAIGAIPRATTPTTSLGKKEEKMMVVKKRSGATD
jgi:hypothetical protein